MRIAATAGVFFMLLLIALGRVVQLSVVEGAGLRQLASRQQHQHVAMPPERGPIVDRHGDVLALTLESAAVYVRPGKLDLARDPIPALAATLNLPPSRVAEKARSQERFVWLLRGATLEQADAIATLALPGVGSEPTRRRFYPRGSLAGQVLGFAGIDSQGLEGVELAYDHVLRGSAESLNVGRDARGRRMLTEGAWQPLPRQGARVELTIDANLQQVAESELAAAVSTRRAAAGIAVVMQPSTGEILALASVPSFDPNNLAAAAADRWRNRAVADSYEPGSTCDTVFCDETVAACCFPDATCADLIAVSCLTQGGRPSEPGVLCGTFTCVADIGACCFDDASCDELKPFECFSQGGRPSAPGVLCEDIKCQPSTGACCFPDATCNVSSPRACGNAGGTPQEPGSNCEAAACERTAFACCLRDGTCEDANSRDCRRMNGTFLPDVLCESNPCTP
jgi:hypothetical protein